MEITADSGYQGANGTNWRALHKIHISPGRVTVLLHALLAVHQQQRSLART
ncbi:hypothetical protein [Streptomyces sp. NPDC048637]|uniref:hypothetical protein n=1 Tax=Streptomyces sp. NPDC048637 TaxID=3155636 RepID=UPI00342CA2EC